MYDVNVFFWFVVASSGGTKFSILGGRRQLLLARFKTNRSTACSFFRTRTRTTVGTYCEERSMTRLRKTNMNVNDWDEGQEERSTKQHH
jgi:hypothetical protein